MAGQVKFNGADAYTIYGLLLQKGAYQELTKPPGAWPDETRQLALPIAIIGNGEVDFWAKYNAFRVLVQSGADIILEVQDLHRRFKLAYSSISDFQLLSKVTGVGRMGAKMVLNVLDDYPDVFTSVRTQEFTPLNGLGTVTYTRTYTSYSQADADLLKAEDSTYLADGQAYADGYIATYPSVPVSPTYYGPASAVPTTAAQVKALAGLVGAGVMNFTLNTGLNRIMVVAIPASKSIQSVWDVQAEEWLTTNYKLVRSITIDGADYKIMALQNAIAYSSNHSHEIVLKNG